jgi:hypothetical protein
MILSFRRFMISKVFIAGVIFLQLAFVPVSQGQVAPTGKLEKLDLSSSDFDWNSSMHAAWPDKKWDLDPWWETALEIVKAQVGPATTREPRNKIVIMVADDWNKMVLKALKMNVSQLTPTVAHQCGEGKDSIEITSASFLGPVEFEIRQSIWVWAIWIPKASIAKLPSEQGVLSTLPEAFRSRFVPVKDSKVPAGTQRLAMDGLPPYIQDMLLIETAEGVCLSGSKIVGAIAKYPGHSLLTNRVWFGGPEHKRGPLK